MATVKRETADGKRQTAIAIVKRERISEFRAFPTSYFLPLTSHHGLLAPNSQFQSPSLYSIITLSHYQIITLAN